MAVIISSKNNIFKESELYRENGWINFNGEFRATDDLNVYGSFPYDPDKTYILNSVHYVSFYDKDNNFIATESVNSSSMKISRVPNARFILISAWKVRLNGLKILSQEQTFTLEAEPELTEEENGMVTVEIEIQPTENNQKFIKEINEHWIISGIKKSQYGNFHIQHLDKQGNGDWPVLKVTAVAEFIHKLQTTTFDGYHTGSRTAAAFYNELSRQSGITFQPVDFKPAFGWGKFGLGVHNISEFNRSLNNYGYTYYPVTSQIIELRDKIGRDVQFMIKNAMNSDNMKMEVDRTEVYTYAEGYADYSEDEGNENFYENANLYAEYKHPVLYDLLGELKAETYTNQKINNEETLKEYLKNIVDNSIKFTITTDFRQIENYPFAVPMLGDRIRVQDDAIDIDTTAKIVKIKTKYDTYGDVIDYEIDFGNMPVSERVKGSLSSTQRQLEDLITGRNPVNMGMLDANVSAVIAAIKEAETEIIFGSHLGFPGLILVDPNDPNMAVGLASKGIVATEDGFAGDADSNVTINGKGINASMVRFGTLWLENFLGIIGKDSLLELNAEYFKIQSADDPSKFLEMNINTGFTIGGLPFTQIAPDGRVLFQDGYQRGAILANVVLFNSNPDIQFNGMNWQYASTSTVRTYYLNDQYKGRFLDVITAIGVTHSSPAGSARVDIEVVTTSGDIVAATNVFVGRTSSDMDGHRIRCDLQALFGTVPDFRRIGLYVQTKTTVNVAAELEFRVNGGEFYA